MSQRGSNITALLAAVAILFPVGFALWLHSHADTPSFELLAGQKTIPASVRKFRKTPIGPESRYPARVTNIQILDFDQDGHADVLACDVLRNAVILFRGNGAGEWDEQVLGDELIAPAHATVVDLDRDGDPDIVVSVLGSASPSDARIGRVVLLNNDGGKFTQRILLDDVRRVADVQAADFDGDDDVDLVVAEFGYSMGSVMWLENLGQETFLDHRLHHAPGAIHVPVSDFDGDGDPDIVTVISQDEEEVFAFENLGKGQFRTRSLYHTFNFDIGTAGLVPDDLDGDGDTDLLLPVGDNLEYEYTYPQPYHGCLWLENRGDWTFETKRIATFGGAYAAAAGDLDADGDRDVVLVSMVNEWQKPNHAALVWLENDGSQNFTTWRIDERPTHLVTVACGDINGDEKDDIVAGSLKVLLPMPDPTGRITSWLNQ